MTTLPQAVYDYLALRRGLGFKLRDEGRLLEQFVAFLAQQGAPVITRVAALAWATQPADVQPAYWARRLSVVRAFARYRSATDPRTEIPPLGLLAGRYRRIQPHLYTDDELARLLRAAGQLPSATGLRAQTYVTLFGLLIVTGMRISEVVALDRTDVDLDAAVLTVRRTKFGQSRLVPVHASTRRALRQYAGARDRVHPRPATAAFLVSEAGTRVSTWAARRMFIVLSHQIGLREPGARHGPRLHDLRHRWAVDTLRRWYQEGLDVERHLPELATYLGHVHITDTYWYLTAVPELMHFAVARLENRRASS